MSRLARWICTALVGATLTLTWASPAFAAPDECDTEGDLNDVASLCEYPASEVIAMYNSGDGMRYKVVQQCKTESRDGVCFNPIGCESGGTPGTWYDLWRDDGSGWEAYGVVCLTAEQAGQLGAITPELVFQEMAKLRWPTSEIVIQPPGGETLVNLETNFYTTNTSPSSQAISLLGQRVEIEATPGSYVWHWAGKGESGSGADAEAFETASPGAAYPQLDVTHVYTDADITVHPWIDTVYSGRYRVNNDAWITIPQTLTVAGPPVELTILEARPVLVS